MLQNGEGVGKDAVKALVWYKKSAEKGDVISIRNLGIAYEFGQGTKINIKKAIALYKKAAELGSGSAMFNLAVLY
jgi:TPR repeat protein